MRHIKRFNESVSEEDIRDFCETHLAYLMDNNYEFEYFIDRSNILELVLINDSIDLYPGYKWEAISNHYIPFLYLLNKKYKLYQYNYGEIVQFSVKEDDIDKYKYFTIDQVINNDIDVDSCRIRYISIKIDLTQ